MPTFDDKFVAFIDILGFKNRVAAAELGRPQLSDLLGLLEKFQASSDQEQIAANGPIACPQSPCLSRDLGFRATQVSDSLIVSAEVSPAGLANLLGKCWGVTVRFLHEAVLCRGYITRGPLFHEGANFIGSGYQRAYEQEPKVAVFGRALHDGGTPFVEIDPVVTEYVAVSGDSCLQKIYDKCILSDGEYAALFPFSALPQSFMIGGIGAGLVDYTAIREGNVGLRNDIEILKRQLWTDVDKTNARIVAKIEHYVRALDSQLDACNEVDRVLEMLGTPRTR